MLSNQNFYSFEMLQQGSLSNSKEKSKKNYIQNYINQASLQKMFFPHAETSHFNQPAAVLHGVCNLSFEERPRIAGHWL